MRHLLLTLIVFVLGVNPLSAQAKKPQDPPEVASAKKKLAASVTVHYKETPLQEVVEDLKKQVESLSIYVDNPGGVSNNQKITFEAADKPLAEVLDGMFKNTGLGYVIGREKDKRYKGWLIIKKGNFRGDEKETKVAEKPPDKGKPPDKPEAADKPPAETTVPPEDPETTAASLLKGAKRFQKGGFKEKAKEYCKKLLKKYPDTKAAPDAKKLLDELSEDQ